MSRSDDLVPFLTPDGQPDVGFRQGIITAFDAEAGTNTVVVGGTELHDLQVLSASGTIFLYPGDIVGIYRFQSTYFIMGRIASVNFQRANFLCAGVWGPADPQFNSWPSTTAGTDTDLWVGQLERGTPSFFVYARTYVGPNTTGVFRITANGHEVANSGTYTGGTTGLIGNFSGTFAWPDDTVYNTVYTCSITARVSTGTGKLAASVQGLYML